MKLINTALLNAHKKLNAKMVPFAGFNMPLQYTTSVKDEVKAVRSKVGLFDVSHMGQLWISGEDTYRFIDAMVTNHVLSVECGRAIYSPLCRENGTIIDDVIVYKIDPTRALICVNATNITKDFEWLCTNQNGFKVKIENRSQTTSLIAVQGPLAAKIMQELEIFDFSQLAHFGVAPITFKNEEIIIARTGYTGEDGFELFCPDSLAQYFWDNLVRAGSVPCGLAARDVLRIEAGHPLYGNEIHDEVTPLDSALKWTVKFNKDKFIGKEALNNYQTKYRLIKLKMDQGIPRQNYRIFSGDQEIGFVTSGTFSPTIKQGIALGHIRAEFLTKSLTELLIEIRNKKYIAKQQTGRFIDGGHK